MLRVCIASSEPSQNIDTFLHRIMDSNPLPDQCLCMVHQLWLPGAEECSVLDAGCQCLTLFAEQIINSPASTTKEHFLYLLLHIASLPNHQELLPRLTQALKSLTVSYLQKILQECVAIPLPHLVSSLVQFQLARLWQQNYSARRDGHKDRWIQAAQFWGILCSLYPQVPCPARDLSMS